MSNSIVTTSTIKNSKGIKPLTMITAYDYAFAKIFDQAGIDMILVGDSLGNVILGYSSTLPVTMADMIHHTKAVTRACSRTLVVADMPFMSYQVNTEQALTNAGRLVKEAGAHAVKLEGGAEITATIEKLVQSGIPVVGHLGLTPQSVNQLGGFKVQGKTLSAAQKILQDAQALAAAGVFALVLECIPHQLALKITESVSIPTIGIGAGNNCDGQVLVCNDLLGLNAEFTPKFVKKYRNLQQEIFTATQEYINDVQTRTFPATEHTFSMQDDVLEKLY